MNQNKWFPDSRTLSNLFVVLCGIAFYLALSNISVLQQRFSFLMRVLNPFLMGFAIAYLLNAPTGFLEQKVFYRWKHKRALAIFSVYILGLATIMLLLNLAVPQLVESVMIFISNANDYLKNLNTLAESLIDRFHFDEEIMDAVLTAYYELMRRLTGMITDMLPQIFDVGVALSNWIISVLTAVAASIYMLAGKKRLMFQLKKLIYAFIPQKRADRVLEISRRANRMFSGFIIGKLIDSLIIGTMCYILCLLIRIPFALLMGTIVGVTNIIPFFGPIIGAIPCLMILIIVEPWSALWFLILIILLQQFDGNILGPKILGESTGLSAIWVLVAIVVGGGLFGFPGMLLGVPTFAVLYSIMRDITAARLEKKGIYADGTARKAKEDGDSEAKEKHKP